MDGAFMDYIAEEIQEEARLGYLTEAEKIRRLALIHGLPTTTTTSVIFNQAGSKPRAEMGADDDAAIDAQDVQYPGASGAVRAYLVRPRGLAGKAPGLVLVHENKGLVPYIRDVARRWAKSGYVALAPDLLSPSGGTDGFADPAEATAALGKQDPEAMVADLHAAVQYLAGLSEVRADRLGATGFCFGGGMTWRLITVAPELKAAVPFYGPNPPLDRVAGIQAAVLAIYGGLDERINAGIPAIEAKMQEQGKVFEKVIYAGAQHAFHNDTNPDRYHAEAARQAWDRAEGWFDQYLRRS